MREALLATGLTDADIPEGRDERAARWRVFLTERRVVLDALGARRLISAEVDGLVAACEGLPLLLVLCGRMLRHRLRLRPSALTAPGGLELLEPGVLAAITSSVRRLDPASTTVLRQVVATGHVPDVVPADLVDSNLLESRLHGAIDQRAVVPLVKRLVSDPVLGGVAQDALDDMGVFARGGDGS